VLGAFPSPLQIKQICDAATLPNVCWSPWCFVKSLSQVCGWGVVLVYDGLLVVRFSYAPSHGHFRIFFFFSVKDIRSVVSKPI